MLQDSRERKRLRRLGHAACATTALQAASVLQQSIKELAVISVVQESARRRTKLRHPRRRSSWASGPVDSWVLRWKRFRRSRSRLGLGLGLGDGAGSGSIIILVRCPRSRCRCRRQKGALCESCLSPLRRRNYSEIAVEWERRRAGKGESKREREGISTVLACAPFVVFGLIFAHFRLDMWQATRKRSSCTHTHTCTQGHTHAHRGTHGGVTRPPVKWIAAQMQNARQKWAGCRCCLCHWACTSWLGVLHLAIVIVVVVVIIVGPGAALAIALALPATPVVRLCCRLRQLRFVCTARIPSAHTLSLPLLRSLFHSHSRLSCSGSSFQGTCQRQLIRLCSHSHSSIL